MSHEGPSTVARRARSLRQLLRREALPHCTCGCTQGVHRDRKGRCRQCDCERFTPAREAGEGGRS